MQSKYKSTRSHGNKGSGSLARWLYGLTDLGAYACFNACHPLSTDSMLQACAQFLCQPTQNFHWAHQSPLSVVCAELCAGVQHTLPLLAFNHKTCCVLGFPDVEL
jgi:hypothetical protein